MDSYIQALQKPEFLLSVVAAIGIILFQPLFENLRSRIINLILGSSRHVRIFIRNVHARHMHSIKRMRRNDAEIMYQVVRNYAFLILFMGSIAFYLTMIALGPLKEIGTLPISLQYFISAPMFIFEVLWLLQNSKTRDLVLYRGKLRLKRRQVY